MKDTNKWLDIFGLDTFYILKQGDKVVYYGITERDVELRLQEHARDGKAFDNVSYVDDLPDRAALRDLEGSSLYHLRNAVSDPMGLNRINQPGKKPLEEMKINDPEGYKGIQSKADQVQSEFDNSNGKIGGH